VFSYALLFSKLLHYLIVSSVLFISLVFICLNFELNVIIELKDFSSLFVYHTWAGFCPDICLKAWWPDASLIIYSYIFPLHGTVFEQSLVGLEVFTGLTHSIENC
jgi:hypothetical protein